MLWLLRVTCNLDFKSHQWTFLCYNKYSVTIRFAGLKKNIHWSVLSFEWILYSRLIFLTSWISHLENAQTFQMLTYFIQYLKVMCINITISIIGKLSSQYLQYWEATSSQLQIQVSKPLFFFSWKLKILSLVTNTVDYFPWSYKLTSFIFEKISAKYPSLNIQRFSGVFQVKSCSVGNAATSTFSWDNHTL